MRLRLERSLERRSPRPGVHRTAILFLAATTVAQNAAVQAATGEILIFSDVTTVYAPETIRAMVENFADPAVGCVGGGGGVAGSCGCTPPAATARLALGCPGTFCPACVAPPPPTPKKLAASGAASASKSSMAPRPVYPIPPKTSALIRNPEPKNRAAAFRC